MNYGAMLKATWIAAQWALVIFAAKGLCALLDAATCAPRL
jgi:hypothetical protein